MNNIEFPSLVIKINVAMMLVFLVVSCVNREPKVEIKEVAGKKNTPDSALENEKIKSHNTQTIFQLSNFDSQISDVVRTIFQDSKGNIWFGTQNGAFKNEGNSLFHLESIIGESGNGVTIKAIIEDHDGRIWFGHSDGVSVLDGEFTTNYYQSDGLLSNDVWCLAVDKQNHIWIGTIDGVCKFDGSRFTAFEIPEGRKDETRGVSSAKMIHNIMEDSQGRIWFSTNGGVYIKDKNSLSHLSEKDGLNTSFVNQVIEDNNGNFWISTSKGLFRYVDNTLTNMTEGIIENVKGTGSIIQDTKGNIWFNSNLRDIYAFDGKNFHKHRITAKENAPSPFQVYEDQQARLWFVGFGGAYRYENEKFINIKQNGPF